ncbi:hypothetical protein JCM10450v2_002044 [Rhodotorula kratochvilovae]
MSLEMEVTDELRDPTELSAQERTDELVEAVRRDDVFVVVFVLRSATSAEVNGRSTVDRLTALEAAVSTPLLRPDVRLLIVECLLLSSAESASALQLAHAIGADEIVQALRGWSLGGREAAAAAGWLCDPSTAIEDAELWIEAAGYALSGDLFEAQQEEEAEIVQVKTEDVDMIDSSLLLDDTRVETEQATASETPPPRTTVYASPARTPPPPPASPTRVILRDLPPSTTDHDVSEIVSSVIGVCQVEQLHVSPEVDEATAVVSINSQADAMKAVVALNGVVVGGRKIAVEAADYEPHLPQPRYPPASFPSPPAAAVPAASYIVSPHAVSPPAPVQSTQCEPRLGAPASERSCSMRGAPPSRRSSAGSVPPATSAHSPQADDWIYVSGLSPAVSERKLHEILQSEGYSADDIFVEQPTGGNIRFAFVRLRSPLACRGAMQALSKRVVDGMRLLAQPFDRPGTRSTRPEFSGRLLPREPYEGPRRNAAHPPFRDARDIVLDHLPERATASEVTQFIERHLGRDTVVRLKLDADARVGSEKVAYVELDKHSDALAAFNLLDGRVFQQHAVSVIWDLEISTRNRRASTPPRNDRRRLSPRRSLSPHRPSRVSANGGLLSGEEHSRRSSASDGATAHKSPPHKPLEQVPSPLSTTPPAAPAAAVDEGVASGARAPPPTSSEDIARLRTLGLTDDELVAVQRAWDPLDHPPDDSFDRSIPLTARFGYLPRREAKMALDANAEKPAYPDDEAMQRRFEAFLSAQAGESRDWYTIFLAKVAEFNELGSVFAETGRRAAASMQQD